MTTEKPLYQAIDACRVCKSSDLVVFWSADQQYIVNFPKDLQQPCAQAPIVLCMCENCGLVQLKHSVEPDYLYKEFFYRSGINEMMKAALRDVVTKAIDRCPLKSGDSVLDIGCNDGTLLWNYPDVIRRFGVDPAKNLQKPGLQTDGWEFINDYFSEESCGGRQYKVITAIAMFYDLEDPVAFCLAIRKLLTHDGIFVVQMNYLGTMLRTNGIDNVSHEHLCYYSLTTLKAVFERAGLRIFDVEINSVNGGSIRVYACRAGIFCKPVRAGVDVLLLQENVAEFKKVETYRVFINKVKSNMKIVDHWIDRIDKAGQVIHCYGASTRGMTFLQYLKNARKISIAAERDENKYGRYIAGTWQKIVPETTSRPVADFYLCLPWHFWPAIQLREKEWMMHGGKFIVPFPDPKIFSVANNLVVGSDVLTIEQPV